MYELRCKRIYESYEETDGFRILVDRLWPRGINKERAHLDRWAKEIAPSADLRKWFAHTPDKYKEFSERYLQELDNNPAAQEFSALCLQKLENCNVTLLYAAKDETHNQARVLDAWLDEKIHK